MVGLKKKLSVFLTATLIATTVSGVACATTPGAMGDNIVVNGNFKEDAKGWNGLGTSGGRTSSWVDGVEGTNDGCLSIVYSEDATQNNGNPGFTQGIKLERDAWYVMSARVKIMDFDPSNSNTPKDKVAASIYMTDLPELTNEEKQWHAYAVVAQDTPIPVTEYEKDGKTMCSTEWTTVRGYYKYSGPESYDNANCNLQVRGSRDNNTKISYYVDDIEVYKIANPVANGGFEDTGYSTSGRISSTAGNTTSFNPWGVHASGDVVFSEETAQTGTLGAHVKMTGATTSTLPALSQDVSLPLGQNVNISASMKIADGYTLPEGVTEAKAQILFTHNTYATDTETEERKLMDCGTDYVATVNIADGEWHQLTKDYNTSWNIEATSRGKAKDPANCNGRMYFRLTAVVDGVENRDIVIPYYVDDVAITASDIQVGQMEFFESHDLAPIEYLTETDEIFGRVNITNNTGKENSVNVMMAGYNYKNQLVQLISEPLTIGENENSVTYKTQNALNISKGITKAKLMVWSSNFETAKPYAAPCEITGDFNKINNSLNKLYSTGKLCVGFIGGSITQGSGASASTTYGYAYQTIKWMKERFSQYEIEGHVAGVGGTGSDLGTCRLNEELLIYNPDLVFVEFAVNDGGDPGKKASTEGIIRQVKEHNPNADIVLINTLQLPGFANDYGAKKIPTAVQYKNEVADHYNLGVINVGKALYYTYTDEGKTEPGYYMKDNAHPDDPGHTNYKDTIARWIDSMIANADLSVESSVLVDPMDENYFTGSVVGLDQEGVKKTGTWAEQNRKAGKHNLWDSNNPGDTIEYTFTGTGLGLYMRVAPDTGIINFQIDGGEIKQFDTCDQYVKQGMDRIFYTFLETSLDRAEHTVNISVSGEKNPACNDCTLSIGALLIKD
ncbi:SGNH/GDSL hydrolase family protein [Congzhengia minquanensis]|uniref:SGNH hydrolase-type esterase domain-containing protein n=1 Tax=Congzhengia minquanensis TaxID=2763657 RepID=A0A926HXV2_9FIRM|nr:SGNH/GDSL hydrolase family protein [Congzhengia minquanensis]MBC8539465.1 hypothetical protein [Congzhengia minquanensis]